jgi:hypothetical protein
VDSCVKKIKVSLEIMDLVHMCSIAKMANMLLCFDMGNKRTAIWNTQFSFYLLPGIISSSLG